MMSFPLSTLLGTVSKAFRDAATRTDDNELKDDILLMGSQLCEVASNRPEMFIADADADADANKSVPTIASTYKRHG